MDTPNSLNKIILAVFLLLVCMGIIMQSNTLSAQTLPLINEIMSSNTTSIEDEDGDHPDWIELYNPSTSAIDLSGYGLSDEEDNYYKWVFPSVIIGSGEHLIVFASDKNRDGSAGGNLHTGFKINNDGEYLSLTTPSGTIVDELDVPALSADTSWGRVSDASSEWQEFSPASPDMPNGVIVQSGAVSFSHTTGFYSSSISVTITSETSGAVIRYTTDSSDPTTSSPQYSGSLPISHTTVIRARAFEQNNTPGPIATVTYSFEEHPETIIPEYFITCAPADYDYIYEHPYEDTYIPVTVTYNGEVWSDTRMRLRGDGSRSYPKKSFKMQFDGKPFANGRDELNFNGEYYDRSYISQYLSSYILERAGYPVFDTEYARLYLNGDFLGLYLRVENVDEAFLTSNGLDPEGNLYKATYENSTMSQYDYPDSLWEKKTNKNDGIEDLVTLIDSINAVPDHEYLRFAQETFEYDKMVDILALNMLVAHGSTYYHNYFMYHDIHGNGKWTMLPWDMDKSMGTGYGSYLLFHRSSPTYRSDNPFLERALLTETIRSDIQTRITTLSQTAFTPSVLIDVVDSLKTVLETSVAQDDEDGVSGTSDWLSRVDYCIDFINTRTAILNEQFAYTPLPFRVENNSEFRVRNEPFVWHPTIDPNGNPVSYTFKLSNSYILNSYLIESAGLTDTTYTLTEPLSPGTYYWGVTATNGSQDIDGYNSWNMITVKEGGLIPSSITSDLTLSTTDSPYLISQDVTVAQGSKLTIPPGVELQFEPSVSMTVYGSIEAKGTSDEPIVIRAAQADTRWGVIFVDTADDASLFEHVEIYNGSDTRLDDTRRAAISSLGSEIVLRDVLFDNNGQSFFARGGSVLVENCRFEAQNISEPINIANCDSPIVTGSYFNNYSNADAIDFDTAINATISNNTIIVCQDDGIDIGLASDNVHIFGNTIYNCTDKGISIGEQSINVTVDRNVIVGCDIGIAVKDSSSAAIDHNTLYGNVTGVSLYLKTETEPGGGIATVTNTIIAGSIENAVSIDETSHLTILYSLSDTDVLSGENNIFGTPGFRSIPAHDFSLSEGSLAIDTGNPTSPKDPDNTIADMGASWYLPEHTEIIINEINYHSAESFDTGDWIELYNRAAMPVNLLGWQIADSDGNSTLITKDVTLPADSFLVLASDTGSFSSILSTPAMLYDLGFGIDNGGETIYLQKAQGVLADSVAFDDESPWPIEPDGNGPTLMLANPADDNAVPASWQASFAYGTPGMANDGSTIVEEPDHPDEFVLEQNFPNPFNPTTTIGYRLPERSEVILTVYSISGQQIETIKIGMQDTGYHTYLFDGASLSSGIYLYRIESGRTAKTGRMVLLR